MSAGTTSRSTTTRRARPRRRRTWRRSGDRERDVEPDTSVGQSTSSSTSRPPATCAIIGDRMAASVRSSTRSRVRRSRAGTPPPGEPQITASNHGTAVDPATGNIYVSRSNDHRSLNQRGTQVMNATASRRWFGTSGHPGQFRDPVDAVISQRCPVSRGPVPRPGVQHLRHPARRPGHDGYGACAGGRRSVTAPTTSVGPSASTRTPGQDLRHGHPNDRIRFDPNLAKIQIDEPRPADITAPPTRQWAARTSDITDGDQQRVDGSVDCSSGMTTGRWDRAQLVVPPSASSGPAYSGNIGSAVTSATGGTRSSASRRDTSTWCGRGRETRTAASVRWCSGRSVCREPLRSPRRRRSRHRTPSGRTGC